MWIAELTIYMMLVVVVLLFVMGGQKPEIPKRK
jgi:hypothetical protein